MEWSDTYYICVLIIKAVLLDESQGVQRLPTMKSRMLGT